MTNTLTQYTAVFLQFTVRSEHTARKMSQLDCLLGNPIISDYTDLSSVKAGSARHTQTVCLIVLSS